MSGQEAHDALAAPMTGAAHVFGANIDTDVIIPARYLSTTDPAELAKHCMEDVDPGFAERVKHGDMIVAGENFGSGSSREHAPISIKAAGVACVVASSFARIFYRNAINVGLPIVECPEVVPSTEPGDTIEVDFGAGKVTNVTRGVTGAAKPFPDFMRELISAGGLVPYLRAKLTGAGDGGPVEPPGGPKEVDFLND